MNYKLPKADTRVRALFDELCRHPNGCVWRDLKDAYDDKAPAYPRKQFGPRYYSNMTISKYIRKFANKSGEYGKRVYTLKPEYAKVLLSNPFYFLAYKDVDRGKIQAIADRAEVRKLADEVREGFEYLDAHRNEQVVHPDPAFIETNQPAKFVADMGAIKAGDWVRVKDTTGPGTSPLKAHGIGTGTYQVEKAEGGFVYLSGYTGGWNPGRFAIVTRPPQNQPSGPRHDKGAPEIRDMAWSDPKPAHNPFEHVYLEQVTKHNKELQDLLKEAEDRRKVLNHEMETLKKRVVELENDFNEVRDQRDYMYDRTADWDEALAKLIQSIYDIQHAEVGQVYSMCDDMKSQLVELQKSLRDS